MSAGGGWLGKRATSVAAAENVCGALRTAVVAVFAHRMCCTYLSRPNGTHPRHTKPPRSLNCSQSCMWDVKQTRSLSPHGYRTTACKEWACRERHSHSLVLGSAGHPNLDGRSREKRLERYGDEIWVRTTRRAVLKRR